MKIRNGLFAVLLGAGMAMSASALAALPNLDVTASNASGLPGQTVMPSVSLAISGFNFESFDLEFVFDPSVLSFLPDASTFALNGVVGQLGALPTFSLTDMLEPDGRHVRLSSFSLTPIPVSGNLVVTGAFKIANAAPAGIYHLVASGSFGTDLSGNEPAYSGVATVTVVPEPETWLLWVAGLGLLARRRWQVAQEDWAAHQISILDGE